MALRHPLVAVTVAAGCLLLPLHPAHAGTGTLTGRITDGKLPPASKAHTDVRAVHLPDGVVAATTAPAQTGGWSFKALEAGLYVPITSVVRNDAKPGVSAIGPAALLKAGRTTRTKLSLK